MMLRMLRAACCCCEKRVEDNRHAATCGCWTELRGVWAVLFLSVCVMTVISTKVGPRSIVSVGSCLSWSHGDTMGRWASSSEHR